MDDDAGRDASWRRLAAARPRLLALAGACPPERSAATRRGAGSTWSSTATTSTTSRSSSRGPTSCALRQADGDPFVDDPRAADHAGFRRPGRGSSSAQFDALVRPSRSSAGTTEAVTPGWTLRDHVGHLADWADEGVRAIDVYQRRGHWLADPDEGIDAWNERMSSAAAGETPADDAGPLRRGPGALLDAVDDADRRGPALAGRLELGLRLPARPRPQAPGDARPVVRRRRGRPPDGR